jgi:hypothetical protein
MKKEESGHRKVRISMRTGWFVLLVLGCALSFRMYGQSTMPTWGKERFKKYEQDYLLSSYIRPTFLQADLSGDKIPDIAVLVERKEDGYKGMIVFFGQNNQEFVVGAGKDLSNGLDNFEWANVWSVFKERATYETTFKENGDVGERKKITLKKDAIKIRELGGSGGLIYFDGTRFTWIHQGS